MQETNSLNQVAEFHTTFKHPILESPVIPSKQRANLRISLLAEELKELQEAVGNQLVDHERLPGPHGGTDGGKEPAPVVVAGCQPNIGQ